MKTAVKQDEKGKNVQNLKEQEKGAVMVVRLAENTPKVDPKTEKVNPPSVEKIEQVKSVIDTFAPSAEDRIKRAANFAILTGKFTHLKLKNEEVEKFLLSSDGTKEKLILENSAGLKIEVNNSLVIAKAVDLLKSTLSDLLNKTDNEVRNFEI